MAAQSLHIFPMTPQQTVSTKTRTKNTKPEEESLSLDLKHPHFYKTGTETRKETFATDMSPNTTSQFVTEEKHGMNIFVPTNTYRICT